MNTAYKLVDQVAVTDIEDEVVLLKLDTGSYFGLNAIGAKLIHGLQEGSSLHEICSQISGLYQTPYPSVQQDLDALVQQLLEAEILVQVDNDE